ncbi:hypothetical protein [Chondromyces apiculatus]|uniref:Uncharacterized protein n=1 Tax=Chondromyces apiculatus DSM 436 TaxID=1192034 RepID=A0A017T9T1_9BACT|nr:hypothetical protein [Chondromyces apiculatus]EYF05545.1 Hypothetical protein CAP_3093 [Chondromyces apiculatus DSM 436]
MLAPDVRFEGFTATDWLRVLSLFQPRQAPDAERSRLRPPGGVVAIHAEGRLRKLVHTQAGRLQIEEPEVPTPAPETSTEQLAPLQPRSPLSAESLAERHHATWALSLEMGTLEAIMEQFGAQARRGDDLTAQALLLVQLALKEHQDGKIDIWPRLPGVPMPTQGKVVRGTLDVVCPVGKTMLLGLFEKGELWTCIALRRGSRGFNLILGPDEIREDMGLLAGDWRRDYRHLGRAVEHRAGPLSLGCFAEASTFRSLEVDPSPGAWARAVTVRDVILSPVTPVLGIPLGIDAGRAAVAALRTVAERVDPTGVVAGAWERSWLRQHTPPMSEAMRSALEWSRREDVAAVLGFHPLDLLRRLLSRER